MGNNRKILNDNLFSVWTLILVFIGLALNLCFTKLVDIFDLPLYLDSIGTIVTSIFGGHLPGIIVGSLSNVIYSTSNPITLFFGFINVLFALLTTYLARRGTFRSWKKALLSIFLYAFIGGILGSVLSWLLNGGGIGTGVSSEYANYLHLNFKFSGFFSQLLADILIDLLDKLITIVIVMISTKLFPHKFLNKLPHGREYIESDYKDKKDYPKFYSKISLRSKVAFIIIITSFILSTVSITISYSIYKDTMDDSYIEQGVAVTTLMKKVIDGDQINGYLKTKVTSESYKETENKLYKIYETFSFVIEYMYVYQIREDGCYVVFDLNTNGLVGDSLGSVVKLDSAFNKQLPNLLRGEEVNPVISNRQYGWLLTVYEPIFDSEGNCVAYAASDISMSNVVADRYIYIIKMITLLFGISIMFVTIALFYAQKNIVDPINSLTLATRKIAYDSDENISNKSKELNELEIKTGDEIESLYSAINKTTFDMLGYINEIDEKNSFIAKLQDNIIISFAEMVESRDSNTGSHIRRTSDIVRIMGEKLLAQGSFKDELNEDSLERIVKSSPLHDIGKIKIPDAILNKPGKLTAEEFAVIKTHPIEGSKILRSALVGIEGENYLYEAINMAKCHHERIDGKDYPLGLKGDEIPLSGKIMAVADVFDALTSKRSYKEPFDFETSVKIIKEGSGTQFDSVVIDAFLSSIDEIKNLMKHYN